MNLSVLIATYGSDDWANLALSRAHPSAEREEPGQIVLHHDPDGTVSTSRNEAARRATGDWLCFLDGDDELAPGFVRAMRRAEMSIHRRPWRDRVLFTPAASYVRNGRQERPMFWPPVPLEQANWLVIGTVVHRDLFWEVGGFKDYGDPVGSNAYEDWAVWSRCVRAGAQIVKVPRAVYTVHVDTASRHRGASQNTQREWHYEIGRDVWPEHYGPDAEPPLKIQRSRR